MKTKLRTTASLAITFLSDIDGFLSFLKRIISTEEEPILTIMDKHTILQIISPIAIFIVVYYLLGKISRVQKQMEAYNIMIHYRTKYLFTKHYDGIEYFRLQDESEQDYEKRLPSAEFNLYLQKEYKMVKGELLRRIDVNFSEATELVDVVYGAKRKAETEKKNSYFSFLKDWIS